MAQERSVGLKRWIVAFLAANIVFFFFNAVLLWLVTRFNITPYGRFVAFFFKGRTPNEAKEFIVGNKAIFDQMLPEAVRFSNLCILPMGGLVLGFIAGLILRCQTTGRSVLTSIATSLPMAALFVSRSRLDDGYAVISLLLFLAAAGAGGAVSSYASRGLISKDSQGAI